MEVKCVANREVMSPTRTSVASSGHVTSPAEPAWCPVQLQRFLNEQFWNAVNAGGMSRDLGVPVGRVMWFLSWRRAGGGYIFFNTVLSLWVTPSPHFLSFFPRLSLCGVAWFSSQHGEAWRLSAYQPGPFILLTTCHSSPSVDRGWFAPDWSFPFWLEWRSFILTSLFQTF